MRSPQLFVCSMLFISLSLFVSIQEADEDKLETEGSWFCPTYTGETFTCRERNSEYVISTIYGPN